ncbi:MAG: 2-hydroxychromene-2-carboxylate isomerase [Halieaceae bacterium]|jgi:2-hydroxychromene-2-carboxylate isomerase|nr:2-hydroxychromene-2-carboxylate isomerase [Halieaceae bacterium]
MEIDVFWSFRSPWSYLATRRLRHWQEQYQLQVNLRVVYPLAIRMPEFFDQVQPQWISYFVTDVFRVAEFLELPFAFPKPDPVIQLVDENGRRETAPDQPYIYRLTRLGALAEEMGASIEFADEMSSLIWGGTKGWDQGDLQARAAERAGLNLEEMDRRIIAEEERLEAQIEKNQTDHEHSGHWGVPTCAFKGEAFFGQDRLDVLLWRLKKEGLQRR